MKIEHIALWTNDIDKLSDFYVKFFDGTRGERYVNPSKKFESYFISFSTGCRLEIMKMEGVPDSKDDVRKQFTGFIHFAFEVGNEKDVLNKTEELSDAGYEVIEGPRKTGDGYFESVILDPDENRVELTAAL